MNRFRVFKRKGPKLLKTGRKVDFMISGAQKSGTTALDAYLRRHPDICMADKKEVHFFDNEPYFFNGQADYETYHSFFSPKSSQNLVGEATPSYMFWYEAPKRIWQYNPKTKLIIILRNPIERAYSHWNMQRDRGKDNRSFWEAINNEYEKCKASLPLQSKMYSYIARGFYTEQIRRLRTYFPNEQILILKNEELLNAPNELLSRIWSFLAIDSMLKFESRLEHSRPYVRSMSARERNFLHDIFEYEIKQLERMLDWDCTAWL